MRGWWAVLILAGCHDPEAESLRARVSAQQKEIDELRQRPLPPQEADGTPTRLQIQEREKEIGKLEGENDVLRRKVGLYLDMLNQIPTTIGATGPADAPLLVVNGDQCWVLYARDANLKAEGLEFKRRLTLACYRTSGKQLELLDVREIAPDLEILQLQSGNRPSVEDVIKRLKNQK